MDPDSEIIGQELSPCHHVEFMINGEELFHGSQKFEEIWKRKQDADEAEQFEFFGWEDAAIKKFLMENGYDSNLLVMYAEGKFICCGPVSDAWIFGLNFIPAQVDSDLDDDEEEEEEAENENENDDGE